MDLFYNNRRNIDLQNKQKTSSGFKPDALEGQQAKDKQCDSR